MCSGRQPSDGFDALEEEALEVPVVFLGFDLFEGRGDERLGNIPGAEFSLDAQASPLFEAVLAPGERLCKAGLIDEAFLGQAGEDGLLLRGAEGVLLQLGAHFAQAAVLVGAVALYPGEDGCVFNEELFSGCEDVYAKLLKTDTADPIADVISVYDLGEGKAILYSEVESQECFLAKV